MIYISLLLVSITLTIWLGIYSWQRRYSPGVTAFSLMMFFGAVWLSTITLMLLSASQDMALFWYRASFVSVSALPVILFVFSAQYSESWLVTPARLIFLFIIPFVTQIAVWTDSHYHLFFKTIAIIEKNGLLVLESWSSGPWFIVHGIYSFIIMFTALVWLFVYAIRQFRLFRGQSIGFILATLVVAVPNFAFAVGLIPPDIILLPFCFLFMGLSLAWAIFHHKLFEVVPVARNKMIDIMSDGMIVLDNDNRILDMNPAAKETLSVSGDDVIGQTAGELFNAWPEIIERFSTSNWTQTEICIPTENTELYYDVRITGLSDRQNHSAGRLILFRDITERKNIEREKDFLLLELNKKNKELETLYGMALDANPVTGLPGNNSVAAAITQAMKDCEHLCVIYTDLDNFKSFNDKYGFAIGDEVIKFTADILKKSIVIANCADSFIGHIGGDDFVLLVPSGKIKTVVEVIIREFDSDIVNYYDEGDLAQGFISSKNRQGELEDFPIMSISIAGVDLSQRQYQEYIEVNDACTGLKKRAKSRLGSAFAMDLRGNKQWGDDAGILIKTH